MNTRAIQLIFVVFVIMILFGVFFYRQNQDVADSPFKSTIAIGMPYATAKTILFENGWRVDTNNTDAIIDATYPEISCGSGYSAVCSVSIEKHGNTIGLLVSKSESSESWIVTGEY